MPPWSERDVAVLRSRLLEWYATCGRDLPWRGAEPYAVWVSEMMLQQTQVATVLPYYRRWLERFPTVADLAAAAQQDVLKAWEGLGYYARARNFHRAAQLVAERHGGRVPDEVEALQQLPGIGRTTAGGIVSAAFDRPAAILDGNVKRVLVRLAGLTDPPARLQRQLWALSERVLDRDRPREFNQALMDLGATVCTPRRPACPRCPWREVCRARTLGIQEQLPVSARPAPLPHKRIGVAVIWDGKKILVDRRPAKGLLGGLWEFPGGKIEPGETVEQCIAREIAEELALTVEVGAHLITVTHAYSHFRVTLHVHHCRYLGGEPQRLACDEVRWATRSELADLPFPRANQKIIAALPASSPF